jgi:energy-coupling factor transport system permease protein
MQDPRIILASAALLSLAAFVSIWGAFFALLWWLVFTPRIRMLQNKPAVPIMVLLLAAVAALTILTGGNGLSYFFRMVVILLIGMWLYASRVDGDFLSVSVWLLGRRAGFEIGMTAEMGMQMADALFEDSARIRTALILKGQDWSIRTILPAGHLLIWDALQRAEDAAELLAVRGYRNGGMLCPVFRPNRWDVFGGICAAGILLVAVYGVSEFFILYR